MILSEHLDLFYKKYNLPPAGGIELSTFVVPLPFFNLILPNFSWRKKMLYIHDLEHILNNQNTSWKGEMYIASWEISTGFWKSFPLIIFPLWTMGWGIWKHPSAVFSGFRSGHTKAGIANLDIPKEQILEMSLSQLNAITKAKKTDHSSLYFYTKLTTWIVVSQLVFWLPLILFISLMLTF